LFAIPGAFLPAGELVNALPPQRKRLGAGLDRTSPPKGEPAIRSFRLHKMGFMAIFKD
jgi:hypothetical protein